MAHVPWFDDAAGSGLPSTGWTAMLRMDPARLHAALGQLQQATKDHGEWQENLLRAIVSGRPTDPDNFREGARDACHFDRWYYERSPVELWGTPAFATLGMEHEHLHRISAGLLRAVAADAPVVVDDFDALMAGTAQLRLKLDLLKQEIRGAWRNCDASTGAYSRAGMLSELRAWNELARRKAQPCCIALTDIDEFKAINDKHGHPVGDAVLAGAVRRFTQGLRPFDNVFRYGSDEFLIVMPGSDLETGQTVIKRVRERLPGRPLAMGSGGMALCATASFGIALLDPDVSVEESVERADQALLLAKTAGTNRIISWDPSVTTGTRLPRLQIEDAKV
jgi:diguanylate cyclase (GGDEF)-like protein